VHGIVIGADTGSNNQYKERARALIKPRISRHDSSAPFGLKVIDTMSHIKVSFGALTIQADATSWRGLIQALGAIF